MGFAKNIRNQICKATNLPPLDLLFEDRLIGLKFRQKYNGTFHYSIPKFGKLRTLYGIKFAKLVEVFENIMDNSKFLKWLGLELDVNENNSLLDDDNTIYLTK